MKTKSTVLTKEERDILILGTTHPGGKYLSNSEIAQRLGIPVSRVKTSLHQACLKLGASNRHQAIFLAVMRGEISSSELYSLNEIAEIVRSLGPDILRRMAQLIRQEQEYEYLPRVDEQVISTARRQDNALTQRERDVIILAGRGLSGREIADRLCISSGAVRKLLYRAYTKLGTCNRAETYILALKQREISMSEVYSLNELLKGFASLELGLSRK